MKIRKILAALLCVALCVCALSGCTSEEIVKEKLEHLSAPANATVNYGQIGHSSEDDTITFGAVEGAVSYQVYVYKDGETIAKVTTGTATTIELPDPLDPGTYNVSVVAVADQKTFANSVGSQTITYTVEEMPEAVVLGQVSNITMDFSDVDPDSSKYPTISFAGVEGASRYLVDVYAADKDGNKQLTSLGYTTRFTVPANQTDGYMIDSTNYGDLTPGWFVVSVTACGDDVTTLNGEPIEANISWVGVDAGQPVVAVTEQENGGVQVALENYENYAVGITVDVKIYADEACTQLLKEDSITYTTSESFGNVTHNNNVAVKIDEAEGAAPDALVTGKTYYAVISLDPEIYGGKTDSEPVAFVCNKAGSGESNSGGSGGGGMPGGPGGGGMSSSLSAEGTFDAGASDIAFTASYAFELKLGDAPDGATYYYSGADTGNGGAGGIAMTMTFQADGTLKVTANGGPIQNGSYDGTWSEADGIITFSFGGV